MLGKVSRALVLTSMMFTWFAVAAEQSQPQTTKPPAIHEVFKRLIAIPDKPKTPAKIITVQTVNDLFRHINDRLAFSKEIAAAKYVANMSLKTTSTYEREEIKKAFRYAYSIGFDIKSVRSFLLLELLLSTHIQANWVAWWKKYGFMANYTPENLENGLMKKLLGLDKRVLDALKQTYTKVSSKTNSIEIKDAANMQLRAPFLTERAKYLIVRSLNGVKLREDKDKKKEATHTLQIRQP